MASQLGGFPLKIFAAVQIATSRLFQNLRVPRRNLCVAPLLNTAHLVHVHPAAYALAPEGEDTALLQEGRNVTACDFRRDLATALS